MKKLLAFLACALILAACQEEKIEPEPEPVLGHARSISTEVTSVSLEKGQSVKVPFTVLDSLAQINYDIADAHCQIMLRKSEDRSASPSQFSLTVVAKNIDRNRYYATITDGGGRKAYEKDVVLGLKTEDGRTVFSSAITVTGIRDSLPARTVETGLPVIYVNTSDGKKITSKNTFKDALISVDGHGVFEDMVADSCQIRGRGNTTWEWSKKPYLIKLEHRREMLGMPKHKRWILLANYMDRSLMRNLLAYEISRQTGLAWTPRCQPCELVLNGQHQGSYLLIEQIRVDENRVNISPEQGFIVESDFHWDNEVQWLCNYGHSEVWPNAIPFAVKYPEPDELSAGRQTEIKEYVDNAMKTLFSSGFKDPELGWRKYMDEASYIDCWFVYELMGNHEMGNPGSVYNYKDADGKLTAGPVWDFDWGTLSYYANPQSETSLVVSGRKYVWYYRLFQDEEFTHRLYERWVELKPKFESMLKFIDEQKEYLAASAALNFKKWSPTGDGFINGDESMTYSDAVDRIRSIYQDRIQVIDQALSKYAR